MQQMIKQLTDATRRLSQQFPYLPRVFRLVHHTAGGLAIVWLLLLLAQGLLPVATVYLTRTLVDGVAGMIVARGGWEAMMPLLPAGLAMALVLISIEVFQSIGKWVRTAQAERVQDHVHELIHEQAMRLDLSFYDAPDYYDQLHRARIDALSRPAALIENAGTLLQSFITLAAMGGVLLTFGIGIPLLLAFSTLPALLVVLRHTIRFHRWRIQNTTAIRKTSYYDLMLTQREAAAEMRLFGLGPHFRALFQDLRKRLRREQVQLARSEAAAQAAAALIGLASMAGALARAFLRRAELIILDEPTSAMDSWAEADWLLRFRQLVAGRTALIITHRFTTALHADMIHVMGSGRIVESGSHEELLSAQGRYEASWTRQMRGKRS